MRGMVGVSHFWAVALCLAGFVTSSGCERRATSEAPAPSGPASATAALVTPPAPNAPAPDALGTPRLVVSVIYDQLGSDTLLAHLDLLDPGGAIRRAVERGVYLERS